MTGALPASSDTKENVPTKAKTQPLDRDSYRVKVEPIVANNDDMVIYRIEVWAVAEPQFSELGFGGMFGRGGLFRRDERTMLYRADFVVVACLRGAEELKRPDGKAQIDLYYTTGGARGVSSVIDLVDASARLNQMVQMDERDRVFKLGQKHAIGTFRGKHVDLIVR